MNPALVALLAMVFGFAVAAQEPEVERFNFDVTECRGIAILLDEVYKA
jgi:hypothetical protein